jgi:hypothetical protein
LNKLAEEVITERGSYDPSHYFIEGSRQELRQLIVEYAARKWLLDLLPQHIFENNDDIFRSATNEVLTIIGTVLFLGKGAHTIVSQAAYPDSSRGELELYLSAPAQLEAINAVEDSEVCNFDAFRTMGADFVDRNSQPLDIPTGVVQNGKVGSKRAREPEVIVDKKDPFDLENLINPHAHLHSRSAGEEERQPKRKAARFHLEETVNEMSNLNKKAKKAISDARKSGKMKCPLHVCHPRAMDVAYTNACAGFGQNGLTRLW